MTEEESLLANNITTLQQLDFYQFLDIKAAIQLSTVSSHCQKLIQKYVYHCCSTKIACNTIPCNLRHTGK